MKLFLLSTNDYDWDEYDAFLIRAKDEAAARAEAVKITENLLWDGDKVSCEVITVKGKAEIIISSFNAG